MPTVIPVILMVAITPRYGVSGDDVATSQTFNCLAYYMGTSQDAAGQF